MSRLSAVPSKHLAIVTCMDARIDPQGAFGLELGSAHVLRNAGAVVSDDILRSLVLSQRLLQTVSVAVMAHTSCGLRNLDEDQLADLLWKETGAPPPFALGTFSDVETHVRTQVERVRTCTWLPHRDDVRGYVLDVEDGTVREVEPASAG